MMKIALFSVLILAASSVEATTRLWESYPGVNWVDESDAVVGDFDGDGRAEAALSTPRVNWTGYTYGSALAVFGADEAGHVGNRGMTVWPDQTISGRIHLAPREGSADRLIVAFQGPEAWIGIFGGVPLRLLRTIPAPNLISLAGVADIDADGQPEIVGLTGTYWSERYPLVLDYASGAVEWVGSHAAAGLGIAQLDADPAFELILAGTPGRIIDAISHEVEWVWPSGFGSSILVGRFASDSSVPTFVASSSGAAQIFRGLPYSPIGEISFESQALIRRVSWQGADQLLISKYHRGIEVVNPRTQAALFTWSSLDWAPSLMAVGNLDADPNPELIYASGSNSAPNLRVIDGVSLQDDYSQAAERGAYSALARGALGGTGTNQVAYTGRSLSSNSILRVLDATTGKALRTRELTDYYYGASPLLTTAQFDADAQDEIVLASRSDYQPYVAVLDGITLLEQWRRSDLQTTMATLALLHVNGDGVPDIVLGTVNGRVIVLNGATGATLWQSTVISGASDPSLAAFTTTTAEPRIAMGRGRGLYVFDPVSGLVTTVIKTPSNITAITQWGSGDACEIGALDIGFVLSIYRCGDLAYQRELEMPTNTRFFRPFDIQGTRFLAASGEALYEVQAGRIPSVVADKLGADVGNGNLGSVIPAPDGKSADVVLGTAHMITRLRVDSDGLFAHGFE